MLTFFSLVLFHRSNDAILIEPKHESIYDYVVDNYKISYVAGGAAQNAARCAQYVLPPKSTVYLGCVGDDKFAGNLRDANDREGLRSVYQVDKQTPTGTCAVVLTGHDRSLVTRLGAAEKFDKSHLDTPEAKEAIDRAKFFYLGGFFLTHGIESALILAKRAKAQNAPFSVNLSAPFIPQFFKDQLGQILPYSSLVFGNESEFAAYAEANNLGTTDLAQIAQAVADLPSETPLPRTVIVSQGADPTLVAFAGKKETKSIPTPKVNPSDIIDTNGAGDAMAGGVLGALILGKSIEEAVAVGQKLGGICIGQNGPTLPLERELMTILGLDTVSRPLLPSC